MAGSNKRGFGSMNQDKQRAIARKGGQAGHAKGTAHEFTSDEAREAGRKGGEAVSRDREHMAEIARKGNRGGGGRSRQTVRSTGRRGDAEGDGMMATDMLRADHE